MTSIRHGLRVMQCSDVSQLDWHTGQMLCNIPPSTCSFPQPQAHVVLIDFSATIQTLDPDVSLEKDDYGLCVNAIARQEYTGMDMKWVFEYWDRDEMKRECWDAQSMGICFPKLGYIWSSCGVDPYKFVYDG